MADIDPVQFGSLTAQVSSLEARVTELQGDMKTMLALANQGRGGFWMGMTIASGLGALVSWIAAHFYLMPR